MRTVCGQFCGIFGGFFAVVGPLLHERCLSQVVPLCLVPEIALPRACYGWFDTFVVTNQCSLCSNLHFSSFFVFFPRRFEHCETYCDGWMFTCGQMCLFSRRSLSHMSRVSSVRCNIVDPGDENLKTEELKRSI